MEQKGLNVPQLQRASGVGTTTIRKILSGETPKPNTRTQDLLADALGVPPSALAGDRYHLPEYTLSDCPVCSEGAYQLNLNSSLIPGLLTQAVECAVEIVPWDEDAKAHAGWALFRRTGEKKAIVARVFEDGDSLILASAALQIGSTHPASVELVDGVNGQILGAIFDLIDSADFFHR